MGTNIYLTAFIITTILFLGVFFFVRFDEGNRINALYEETLQLNEELQANKILISYLAQRDRNAADQNICLIYERQISRQLNRIYDLFNQLEQIETTTFSVSNETARRQYLLTSMSLWIDLKNAREHCTVDIEPVLFFFPETHPCVVCSAMINQLEVLKQQCSNVRVFAFPSSGEEFEFATLLKNEYRVTSSPAIVARDQVFYDVVDMSVIRQAIDCSLEPSEQNAQNAS